MLELPIRANVSLAILDRLRGAIGMLKRRREEEVYRRLLWQAAGQGLLDGSPAEFAKRRQPAKSGLGQVARPAAANS